MIKTTYVSKLAAMLFLALAIGSGSASAQEKETFTPERFAALQKQGALVLLDVHADWCPTCAKQQKILAEYREQYPGVPLHILQIDFDSQKQHVRQFKAPRQSTLILYRGPERIWFSVAETDPKVIFNELNKAAAAPTR